MHEAAYGELQLPYSYTPIEGDSIDTILSVAFSPDFGGSAIAHPFKVELASYLDSLSTHARAIGAINTLIPLRSIPCRPVPETHIFNTRTQIGPVFGLHGDNTDWIGIQALILRGLSPATAIHKGSTALVIGAGGMARAAIYAMLQIGVCNIVICNRTRSRAVEMMGHFTQLLRTGHSFHPDVDVDSVSFSDIDVVAPWPVETFLWPTVVVSCIPTHAIDHNPSPDFVLPESWLEAAFGGVVIEVINTKYGFCVYETDRF
jgi:shikimate 5-dehydrogenase